MLILHKLTPACCPSSSGTGSRECTLHRRVAQRHHKRNLATRPATDSQKLFSEQYYICTTQVTSSEATAPKSYFPHYMYVYYQLTNQPPPSVSATITLFGNLHLRFRRQVDTLATSTFRGHSRRQLQTLAPCNVNFDDNCILTSVPKCTKVRIRLSARHA